MSTIKGIVYRLKNGKTPNSWALKQHQVAISIPGQGMKYIGYFPGSTSIFVDDEVNKNRKPQKVVFEHNLNKNEPMCIFVAKKEDLILNQYLQSHPHFNVHFELFSEEAEAEKKLADFELKEEALMAIKEPNDIKVQSIALAINGIASYGWTATACRAWLKEKALTDPNVILSKVNDSKYQARLLTALAFYGGIIEENPSKTKIVWTVEKETKEALVHLAKGEVGIDKMTDFLSDGTPEARNVLQEIDRRIKLFEKKTEVPVIVESNKETEKLLSDKDAEIERLKAELAKKNEVTTPTAKAGEKTEEVVKSENENLPTKLTLTKAKEAYAEKFKKQVPPRYINDLEWITQKLAE